MSFCMARLGVAGQGAAWRGMARRGGAGQGGAGLGKGCFQRRAGNRSPVQIVSMLGRAWLGAAGLGSARRGMARAVFSGKGSLFPMQTANMED